MYVPLVSYLRPAHSAAVRAKSVLNAYIHKVIQCCKQPTSWRSLLVGVGAAPYGLHSIHWLQLCGMEYQLDFVFVSCYCRKVGACIFFVRSCRPSVRALASTGGIIEVFSCCISKTPGTRSCSWFHVVVAWIMIFPTRVGCR